MKFPKELLRKLVHERGTIIIGPGMDFPDEFCGTYKVLVNEVDDTSRWSIEYDFVFSFEKDGVVRDFRAPYSTGATEMQDEYPFEYEPDMVDVTEVVPVEVTVIQYVTKKD